MKVKRIALIVAVAGFAIMLFGLLTPSTIVADGGMNGGSGEVKTSYSLNNAIIIMIGAMVSGAALSFWAFREDYVPVTINGKGPVVESPIPEEGQASSDAVEASVSEDRSMTGDERLVLRLLNGDERFMYRTIAGMGGSALQKDLIVSTKMSDAKVSRVIDRLIEKGLVTKTRYGVTNRISISLEK